MNLEKFKELNRKLEKNRKLLAEKKSGKENGTFSLDWNENNFIEYLKYLKK